MRICCGFPICSVRSIANQKWRELGLCDPSPAAVCLEAHLQRVPICEKPDAGRLLATGKCMLLNNGDGARGGHTDQAEAIGKKRALSDGGDALVKSPDARAVPGRRVGAIYSANKGRQQLPVGIHARRRMRRVLFIRNCREERWVLFALPHHTPPAPPERRN